MLHVTSVESRTKWRIGKNQIHGIIKRIDSRSSNKRITTEYSMIFGMKQLKIDSS